MPVEEVLGAVLAGGASRRMGFDKRALELDGRTLVVRAAEALGAVCAEVVVSCQPDAVWDDQWLRRIPDLRAHCGPLAGLESVLLAEERSARPVFVLACDLPYVTVELVRHILQAAREAAECAAVVPSLAGRVQPLCGLYRPGALGSVRDHLEQGRRAMHDLLAELPVREVVIDETLAFYRPDLFHNLNEPADLEPVIGASPA